MAQLTTASASSVAAPRLANLRLRQREAKQRKQELQLRERELAHSKANHDLRQRELDSRRREHEQDRDLRQRELEQRNRDHDLRERELAHAQDHLAHAENELALRTRELGLLEPLADLTPVRVGSQTGSKLRHFFFRFGRRALIVAAVIALFFAQYIVEALSVGFFEFVVLPVSIKWRKAKKRDNEKIAFSGIATLASRSNALRQAVKSDRSRKSGWRLR